MLKIKTAEQFIEEINIIIYKDGCSVIEAIVEYSEKNDIDFKKLVPFIESSFKDVIRIEAENRNMLKRDHSQLPI